MSLLPLEILGMGRQEGIIIVVFAALSVAWQIALVAVGVVVA